VDVETLRILYVWCTGMLEISIHNFIRVFPFVCQLYLAILKLKKIRIRPVAMLIMFFIAAYVLQLENDILISCQ
jgi:hypothetical protein